MKMIDNPEGIHLDQSLCCPQGLLYIGECMRVRTIDKRRMQGFTNDLDQRFKYSKFDTRQVS